MKVLAELSAVNTKTNGPEEVRKVHLAIHPEDVFCDIWATCSMEQDCSQRLRSLTMCAICPCFIVHALLCS